MAYDPVSWPQPRNLTREAPEQRLRPLERQLRIVPANTGAAHAAASDTPGPGSISDDELIAALVAGDVAALAVLYERHAQLVFAMLVRILGERDAAEDLLQEAFVRAWQHAQTFDETRGTVRAWLARIAHNLALNELRRLRRRPQAQRRPAFDDADDDAPSVAGPDPAAAAWCAIRDDGLAHALSQLPAGQRAVLTLYAAGFSQSEIAAKLDQPLGTVKSRMRRALCHLREVLPPVGIDAGWRPD